jgi:hypothetical protein
VPLREKLIEVVLPLAEARAVMLGEFVRRTNTNGEAVLARAPRWETPC